LNEDHTNKGEISVQAHPEFTSKVLDPSPVYLGLVAASSGCLDEVMKAAKEKKENLTNGVVRESQF
jgi:CTP synthase